MLGRALAIECLYRVILLEAAICVAVNLSAYAGSGYLRQCTHAVYWVAFNQPVIILHVLFRAISTCPLCLERPHEEQANSAVEKQKSQCGCTYGSWMSSPSGVCSFPQKIISGVNFCFRVKTMLLETQRAVQCGSEIDRVWVVVKLQTIPCHIEFVFGISVP